MTRIAAVQPIPTGRLGMYETAVIGSAAPAPASIGRDLRAYVELPVDAETVRAARELAVALSALWRLRTSADSTRLVVSELVTNAVVAVVRAEAAGAEMGDSVVVFAMAATPEGGAQLDVWDPVATDQALKAVLPGEDAEDGRGLYLVGALSESWGEVSVPVGTQVRARLAPILTAA